MNEPVQITDKAQKEIKNIMDNKKVPDGYGLRVGVKGGGCGVSFVLGFDKPKEDDLRYDVRGIPVYVQKKEVMFLIGKEVDFYEGADARGFVFTDPEKP
ncbi:HesB/IscA family protein [Marinoscillum furvescens]|uniref:Iron-sulfur cluster assembly protein n=1 Tax=Marinoscillum furvescens DSM 4134 TaxID=1122208 RepID=A0A3D9KWJ3_MARFU|nr:iron-sulfur cluster assembly accessory protein [Marinoscillum furvescens]RED92640.1 iron-sulfur cluster assembly protein [Marinoscillum furvescens DSM 4134]